MSGIDDTAGSVFRIAGAGIGLGLLARTARGISDTTWGPERKPRRKPRKRSTRRKKRKKSRRKR